MPEITAHIHIICNQSLLRSDDDPQYPSAVTRADITSLHFCTTGIGQQSLQQYQKTIMNDLNCQNM